MVQADARVAHELLGPFGAVFAAAGEQHQPLDARADRLPSERRDRLGRTNDCDVGDVGDVDGADAVERGGPGLGCLPVEGGVGPARADPHRHGRGVQALGDPATGLAGAAQDEGRRGLRGSVRGSGHGDSSPSGFVTA